MQLVLNTQAYGSQMIHLTGICLHDPVIMFSAPENVLKRGEQDQSSDGNDRVIHVECGDGMGGG